MTPEEALTLAKTVSDIYAQATADLLSLVARRLSKGMDSPRWADERLAELLVLRRDAQRVVSQMQQAAHTEVVGMLEKAYAGGRLSPLSSPGMVATNQRAVFALARDTTRALDSTAPRVLRWTEDIYRQVIAETVSGSVVGTSTRRQVAAKAMDRFARQGVLGFKDSAGRNWSLSSYAEMTTRTATGQAFLEGTLDRYQANGDDLVIVSNSPEECPLCRPYEGNVLSISGSLTAPPGLPEGIRFMGSLSAARDAGLYHPNCTHRADRYVPGLTKPNPDTENPQGYEDRQTQRYLERKVREAKQQLVAAKGMGDPVMLRVVQKKHAERMAALQEFNVTHGRKQGVSAARINLAHR